MNNQRIPVRDLKSLNQLGQSEALLQKRTRSTIPLQSQAAGDKKQRREGEVQSKHQMKNLQKTNPRMAGSSKTANKRGHKFEGK